MTIRRPEPATVVINYGERVGVEPPTRAYSRADELPTLAWSRSKARLPRSIRALLIVLAACACAVTAFAWQVLQHRSMAANPNKVQASHLVASPSGTKPSRAPKRVAPSTGHIAAASSSLETDEVAGTLRLVRAQAVEQLAQGRYREAVVAYRRLAKLEPHEPAYEAIAAILERRLDQRCQGAGGGGAPCE